MAFEVQVWNRMAVAEELGRSSLSSWRRKENAESKIQFLFYETFRIWCLSLKIENK
jgi:hypothetical protein